MLGIVWWSSLPGSGYGASSPSGVFLRQGRRGKAWIRFRRIDGLVSYHESGAVHGTAPWNINFRKWRSEPCSYFVRHAWYTKKHLQDLSHKYLKYLVRLAGFEPATHCLEVRRPYFSFFFMYFYYLVFLDSYKCHILPRFFKLWHYFDCQGWK